MKRNILSLTFLLIPFCLFAGYQINVNPANYFNLSQDENASGNVLISGSLTVDSMTVTGATILDSAYTPFTIGGGTVSVSGGTVNLATTSVTGNMTVNGDIIQTGTYNTTLSSASLSGGTTVYKALDVVGNTGTSLLRVGQDGKIGIGNTNPLTTLDVTGGIKETGNIQLIGNLTQSTGSYVTTLSSTNITGRLGINKPYAANALVIQDPNEQFRLYADATNFGSFTVQSDADFQIYTWTGAAYGNVLLGCDGETQTAGNIGIGVTNPGTRLSVMGADNSTVQTIKINATQANVDTSDTFIDFRSATGSEGTIAGTAVAGVLIFNTFTGSHYSQIKDRIGLEINSLLEIVDEVPIWTKQSETKPVTVQKYSVETGTITATRNVTTEYQASPKPQTFCSQICKTKNSPRAVGVYGGTDKEGRDMVLSIGTGYVWVANKGINIEVGDYLISSDVAGCTEKQGDGIYRNTTVAKATQGIIWKDGEVRRLIRCIYLGG